MFSIISSMILAGGNYKTKVKSSIDSLKSAKSDSLMSEVLYKSITDSVFPDWMGTPWDFNGISNVPGQGMIACGYFVSTTLKHLGFNLNRYKMAQQAAAVVINILCGEGKVQFTNKSSVINALKLNGNNRLYVVGLDFHVGFLAVEYGEVYFIHSDYYLGKVVKEVASKSVSFASTNTYVFDEITNNAVLFNKWKNGIKVY